MTPSELPVMDPELVTSKVVVALLVQGPVSDDVMSVLVPQPLAYDTP